MTIYSVRILFLFLGISLFSSAVYSDIDSGEAGVVDGDGLILNGKEHRLFGIDAVELDQGCYPGSTGDVWKCGQDAKLILQLLIGKNHVSCEWSTSDRYKRHLSVCFSDGVNLNAAMVLAGYAVAYREYSDRYVNFELKAKKAKNGIWASEFLLPWEHRKVGDKIEISAPDPMRLIKGNINRKGERYYHCLGDSSYGATKITEASGEQWFATAKEATDAGWKRPTGFKNCVD